MSVDRTSSQASDHAEAARQAQEAAPQQTHHHRTQRHHIKLYRGTTRFARGHGVSGSRNQSKTAQLSKQLNPGGSHRRTQRTGGDGQGRGQSQQGKQQQDQQKKREQQQNKQQQQQQSQQNGMPGNRPDERTAAPPKMRLKPVGEIAAAGPVARTEFQKLAGSEQATPQSQQSLNYAWTKRCIEIGQQPDGTRTSALLGSMLDIRQAQAGRDPNDTPYTMADVKQNMEKVSSVQSPTASQNQAQGPMSESRQSYNLLAPLAMLDGSRRLPEGLHQSSIARGQSLQRIVHAGTPGGTPPESESAQTNSSPHK